MQYEVEPLGESSGHCDCCMKCSRCVWGTLHADGKTRAAYFLNWTVDTPLRDHPANFDLIVGQWRDGTSAQDRVAISMLHSVTDAGPGVMVVDANERPIASHKLVGAALCRNDVVGTPLAKMAFDMFDAVLQGDPRLTKD